MSKKARTAVPDFSSHKKPTKSLKDAAAKGQRPAKSAAPAPAPRVKPQATSAKSGGRRGG